jgi:hypothetical protein
MIGRDIVASVLAFAGIVIVVQIVARYYLERARIRASATPPMQQERLERIEQAVDAIALEVERISEAQRFSAKLLAERGKDLPKT